MISEAMSARVSSQHTVNLALKRLRDDVHAVPSAILFPENQELKMKNMEVSHTVCAPNSVGQ